MRGSGLGSGSALAAATLVACGVELVVVGGCALVLLEVEDHCGDLDIVPKLGSENLSRLCAALDDLGATRPPRHAIGERQLTSATSPFGRIDLLTETARREYGHLASNASERCVAGVPIPVAAIADVLRLRARFRGADDGE
jgi:hypothetical protein